MKYCIERGENWRGWASDPVFNIRFQYMGVDCSVTRWAGRRGGWFRVSLENGDFLKRDSFESCKEAFDYIRESVSDNFIIGAHVRPPHPADSHPISFGSSDDYREYMNLLPTGYDEQIKRSRDEASRKALGKWI